MQNKLMTGDTTYSRKRLAAIYLPSEISYDINLSSSVLMMAAVSYLMD